MKKMKVAIPEEDFGTLNTKYPPDSNKVENSDFTEGTKNIETSVKGVITKRKGGVVYSTLPNPPRDQYEAIFSDGIRHLLTVDSGNLRYTSGDGNETLVLAGLSANLNFEFATTQDRTYFGNGIQKKVYDRVTNYGGVAYTFPSQTIKDMGTAAPSSAPSVAVVAGGSVPIGSHTYKVTYIYYDSEESNGSTASSIATTTAGNQTVNLTSVPVGGYGVTQRKIYRDDNNGVYVFVGVINNNTATTFSDTIAAGLTPIPDDQGLPPDFTLVSLYLDKLFLAGIAGDPYTVFYSDTGMPDIYPALNYIVCNQEDPITGLVVYLDRLIVFNRRSMGQILGKTSDQFRYADIQGSVGCVDNRSIQIRVIDGVPVLVWLSDKGFYAYNGNSVIYISDVIEDQINSNIQQSVIQKNRVSQSDYTVFTSGTKSDGINLEANQGTITTKGPYWDTIAHPGATYDEQTNPIKIFDTEQEWENGTTKQGIVTLSDNLLKAPIKYAPTLESGVLTTSIISGSTLTFTSYAGESHLTANVDPLQITIIGDTGTTKTAQPVIPQHDGTITNFSVQVHMTGASSVTRRLKLQLFSGAVSPTTLLFSSPIFQPTGPGDTTVTAICSVGVVKDLVYWIVATCDPSDGIVPTPFTQMQIRDSNLFLFSNGNKKSQLYSTSSGWTELTAHTSLQCSYAIQYSDTGQWESQSYDSLSDNNILPININHTGSYPGGSSAITRIETTDDPTFLSGITFQDFNSLNGTGVMSITPKRYFKIRITLNMAINTQIPVVGTPILSFSTQGVWDSEVLDCSSDVSSYQSLTTTKSEPSGTSVVTQIATSVSSSGPWGGSGNGDGQFGSFGSHVVRQYVKLRLILNTDGTNSVTPQVSVLDFRWVVGNGTSSASFISPGIDTGTTPSGWDIFQASFQTNGGAVNFYLRSASTSGGLTSATWYAVSNGVFPPNTLPTLQWIQWRAIIQSSPSQVPTVDSVTIGWFIGSGTASIRCASIFYNKNYYVALAEFENSSNNVLFVLDFEGKWRVFRDLNIATLSYFFNNPYYGDALNNNIVRFLEGLSDQGDPIELDVRTKAFDGSTQWTDNEDKVKVLDWIILSVLNTGAAFDCAYSIDDGMTFNTLYDTSGNSNWTTVTDGKEVKKYLRPRYTLAIPQGRTIMVKIHNSDTKEVQIKSIKLEAFIREQPPIITG